MSDTAIKFENVSKLYRLGTVDTGTLSHDLKRWWITSVRGKEDPYLKIGETYDRSSKSNSDYVYALKDITKEIPLKVISEMGELHYANESKTRNFSTAY